MKSRYWYIIGVFLVIGVAIAPVIVKQNFLKKIEKQKKVFLNHGLKLTIIDERGYLESIVSFNLDIINGKKFRDYILDKPYFNDSTFSEFAKLIKRKSEQNIRPALDGTTFNGVIKYSNSLLKKTTIRLSLIRLSDELMKDVYKNKEAANLILPLLSNKVLTFFVTLNNNQRDAEIRMKNIDQALKLKNKETIDFKFIGGKLKIDDSKRLIGKYALDNQLFKIHEKSKSLIFQTKGLKYKFDYLNQFDSKGSIHIDSFDFKGEKYSKTTIFKFANLDIKSSIKTLKDDTLPIDISYVLNDIYFKNQIKEFELKRASINIGVSGINKQDLLDYSSTYNAMILSGKKRTKNNMHTLMTAFSKIINKGLKANVGFSLSKLKIQRFMLNDISLSLKSTLVNNTADLGNINKYTIRKLSKAMLVNGVLTMDKKDFELISSLNIKLSKIAKLAKIQGDKAIFNIEFKQDSLFINKTKL